MKKIKVAVTGAAGQIGYALSFRLASGQMFGNDVEIDLRMLELEHAMPALSGVAMELDDCAFPLLKNITTTSDANEAFKDVDWAILVGSVPRKDGMERSDLLAINGKVFTAQGKALNENASSDCKVFVVGNPCNTNCLIAMNAAPNLKKSNFFAMTALDEKRARTQLAQKAGVDVTSVSEMTIWGNHSATQYPDFYNAKIDGKSAFDVINDSTWIETDFLKTVQQRGAAIIKARGASSAASAANACVSGVYHLTHDTPAGETFSMALCSAGQYGVEEGLIFSYPCRVENGVLKVVESLSHNDYGQEKFKTTLQELISERNTVKDQGLI